jgi:hypothetical protein
VLGTIAVACAEDAGLSIVAQSEDMPSRELNNCLATGEVSSVYDTFIRGKVANTQPEAATPDLLLDFIVQVNCDVSRLDARSLVKLADERDALWALKLELQKLSESIPKMKDKHRLAERLNDEMARVMKKWNSDKSNLSNFARRFIGLETSAKGVGDALKVFMEKIAPSIGTGALVAPSTYVGVAAGLGIGVIVHSATTFSKMAQRSDESPFRYLTHAAKAGVTFSVSR